jgi:hypothetical protein
VVRGTRATKVAGMGQKAILAKIPATPGMRGDLVKAAQAAIDNANFSTPTIGKGL